MYRYIRPPKSTLHNVRRQLGRSTFSLMLFIGYMHSSQLITVSMVLLVVCL